MRFSAVLLPAALIATPVLAEPPRVVADIAPVHALLAQVMEGVAQPDLLLAQNANPHAVQLKPSQARMLAEADLLVWVGPGLSPWLERMVETRGGDQIALMRHPATHLRGPGQPEEAEDPAHDDHADEAPADRADGDDDHDHSGPDPHVWLSTGNARAWLEVFAETLSMRDPDNAATYRSNAAAAAVRLDALDAHIDDRLAAHQGAEIVTFHESFGYFADQFGLTVAGSVRPGDAAAPSAAAMAELQALVADHSIECAFAEPAFDPGLLDAIAGETGLRIGTLDPTGALQPPGPDHYVATLTAIAEGIAECLERD